MVVSLFSCLSSRLVPSVSTCRYVDQVKRETARSPVILRLWVLFRSGFDRPAQQTAGADPIELDGWRFQRVYFLWKDPQLNFYRCEGSVGTWNSNRLTYLKLLEEFLCESSERILVVESATGYRGYMTRKGIMFLMTRPIIRCQWDEIIFVLTPFI